MILRTRSARRAVRAVAAFCAVMLLSGNVLAAAGLCVMKSPAAAHPASEAPCPEHLADVPHAPTAQHCSADDASAQVRTSDLPGLQLPAAAAVTPIGSFAAAALLLELRADTGSPQRPLYTRLHRLRL